MTATDELRRLLDERGVEWTDKAEEVGLTLAGFADTRWNANGVRWIYTESNGTATLASSRPVEIRGCTPEQAIAATLGSGTCEMYRDEHGIWHCAACERGADVITGNDGELDSWIDSWAPNYCPYCGRKGEQ